VTTLGAVIAGLEPAAQGWRGTVPDTWLQGRTAYGGLSAALALHAAMCADVDLPPLRSALVAFVGPLSGAITVRAEVLRRGRNAAFVQADVSGEAGLGLRATFVFMRAVESGVEHRVGRAPHVAPPGPADTILRGHPAVAFSQHFDMIDRHDADGAEWLRWVRLRDRDGVHPLVALLAVADCLPPVALKLLGRPAPVSSMTWQLNLLGEAPTTDDGWWLLRSTSDYASAGSSSQAMAIWATDGTPVAEQMQSVAVFA
jgi:acyl-CoA thioesterase